MASLSSSAVSSSRRLRCICLSVPGLGLQDAWQSSRLRAEQMETLDLQLAAARAAVSQGADILDIGGQSSRPGASRLDAATEAARVLPLLRSAPPQLSVALRAAFICQLYLCSRNVSAACEETMDSKVASRLSDVAHPAHVLQCALLLSCSLVRHQALCFTLPNFQCCGARTNSKAFEHHCTRSRSPLCRALAQDEQLSQVPVSIDTFLAEVARQAVEAGASIVNDISGGRLDPDMHAQVLSGLGCSLCLDADSTFCKVKGSCWWQTCKCCLSLPSLEFRDLRVPAAGLSELTSVQRTADSAAMSDWKPAVQVAELGVPYVCTHSRGDPGTMQQPPHLQYRSVCTDVGHELEATCEAACAAGIPPWRIILDPGAHLRLTGRGAGS